MSTKSGKKPTEAKPRQPLTGQTTVLQFQHRNGKRYVPQEHVDEIIASIQLDKQKGTTAPGVRKEILSRLSEGGWPLNIKISSDSDLSVTAVKDKTVLCLQTGNMGRIYADMLKMQKLFAKGAITAGIIISPTKRLCRVWGKSDSNLAHIERWISDLKLFSETITIPLVIIGMGTPEDFQK